MNDQFLLSLIVGIFVGGAAGYLGSLMVTKRMALVGDAFGHVALPGIGLALLLGFDVSLGAFLFLLLGALIIWLFGLKTSLPMEAVVGVVFVTSLAIGFLIVPQLDLLEALFGDISGISLKMALISIFLSIIAFFTVKKVYPGLILANICEDLAETQGVNIKKYNLIYLLSVAVIVAIGIRAVGSLLVGALVIIPAATAKNLSQNIKEYSLGSAALGILSSVMGILLFKFIGLSVGPLIILTSAFFFLLSMFFKKG